MRYLVLHAHYSGEYRVDHVLLRPAQGGGIDAVLGLPATFDGLQVALKRVLTDYTTSHGGTKFSVASPQLTAGLAKHGIMPNKTFTLEWPDHLGPEYLRHYVRGYLDGDGSWHLRLTPERAPVMRWEIIGSEIFCLGAQQYLIETLGLRTTKLDRLSNAPRIRRLSYSGRNQVSRIYHLMYDGATVCLPRKRERIHSYVRPLADAEPGPIPLDGGKDVPAELR
jgi:hypothetical protein